MKLFGGDHGSYVPDCCPASAPRALQSVHCRNEGRRDGYRGGACTLQWPCGRAGGRPRLQPLPAAQGPRTGRRHTSRPKARRSAPATGSVAAGQGLGGPGPGAGSTGRLLGLRGEDGLCLAGRPQLPASWGMSLGSPDGARALPPMPPGSPGTC